MKNVYYLPNVEETIKEEQIRELTASLTISNLGNLIVKLNGFSSVMIESDGFVTAFPVFGMHTKEEA